MECDVVDMMEGGFRKCCGVGTEDFVGLGRGAGVNVGLGFRVCRGAGVMYRVCVLQKASSYPGRRPWHTEKQTPQVSHESRDTPHVTHPG
jgi:hypothetical protein